jgi:hypothetical protein
MPTTYSASVDNAGGNGLVLVLLWLAIVIAAFWWFALKDLRPFRAPASAALFTTDELDQIGRFVDQHEAAIGRGRAALTVLHLRDSHCGCNRFADPHVAALRSDYRSRGVQVATLEVEAADTVTRSWLPATPAALVLDAERQVLYLGPLSNAADCGRAAAPVERVLDAALSGARNVANITLGSGCLCT